MSTAQAARGNMYRGAAFLSGAAFIAYCGSFPLVTTDIWWHLAAAREMLARGAFLRTDPFSVTAYGYPWLNVHWLFQLVMYAVYHAGGTAALIAARAVLFAAAWGLLLHVHAAGRTYLPGVLIMVVTAFCVRSGMLMRPGMFTLLFMAAFLFCIERYRVSGQARWLWLLPPVQVLWVNMQGLFPIGPALLVAVLAGEAITRAAARLPLAYVRFVPQYGRAGMRRIAYALGGVLAACLLNPYGWRMLLLPLKLFGVITPLPDNPFTAGVAENVPAWMSGAAGPGQVLLRLAGLGCLVLAAVNRRQLVPFRLILFAGFLVLGVMAQRNMPLYAAVLVPLLTAEAAALPVRSAGMRTARGMKLLAAGGVLLAAGLGSAAVRERMTAPRTGCTVPFRYPAGAAAYLKEHPVPGTLFNAARQGGYLLWHLYPPRRVFTDGRFTIRPGAYLRDYVALLDAPESFPVYFARYAVTHAVVPLDGRQRYAGLAAALYRHPGWVLAYADGADAVFVRGDVFTGVPEDPAGAAVRRRITAAFADPGLRERAFDNIKGMVN